MNNIKLIIFETHPVQYRVPIYQYLNQLRPDLFGVIFASDFSVQGYQDLGFQADFKWDIPLLDGYTYSILNPQSKTAPLHWQDLPAPNLSSLLQEWQPSAVLLTSLNYRFDAVAYFQAVRLRIPIWLRMETQDHAFERSPLKTLLRTGLYKLLYFPVQQAFPIGQLNRKHYLRHGLHPEELKAAHYCTSNPLHNISQLDKVQRRQSIRQTLGIAEDHFLVAFFGKFISKKDPLLLLDMLPYLPVSLRNHIDLLFVGSGELQDSLQDRAMVSQEQFGIRSHFPGFINQSRLPDWYLAADVVVLPSRQMGETWGLVINEALQAGCGVVVSTAVGCHADFGTWERVRTIPVGDAKALAVAITELANNPRDFTWAESQLQDYSIEAAAQSLAQAIDTLS